MIAEPKITEFFCVMDKFNKNFDKEISNHALLYSSGMRRRNRKGIVSEYFHYTKKQTYVAVITNRSYCGN